MYASIVALAANVIAADYIPRSEVRLPEQRYILESKTVEMIGGTPCETLVAEDTWDSIRKKKVSELEKVMKDQDECDSLNVRRSEIVCFDYEGTPCFEYAATTYSDKEECHGVGKNERECCHKIANPSVCIRAGAPIYNVKFGFNYADMVNIRQGDGWWDDDDVIIGGTNIDFKTVAGATKASELLEDLRYISKTMRDDSHTYSIKPDLGVPPKCEALRYKYQRQQENMSPQEKQRQRKAERLEKEKKYVERIKPLQNRIKQELAGCAELHNPTNMGECLSKVKSKYEIIDYDEIPRIID